MESIHLITSFLESKGIEEPFTVWYTTSDEKAFFTIYKSNISIDVPPLPKNLNNVIQLYMQQSNTYIYFVYTTDFQMVIGFPNRITLDELSLQVLFHLLYPVYADSVVKIGKDKLDKIIDSISDTISSLDLEVVFSNILSNMLDVITNADYGTLWLYDEALERIVCKASEGYTLEGIWDMKFEIGEGPVGHSFETGLPILVQNQKDLAVQNIKRVSAENAKYWDRGSDYIANIKSILSYPIFVNGKVECVMYLGQFRRNHLLTQQDLWLLKVFSTQVGIAIHNARQFADIRMLNENLIKRDDIHSTLTNLSIRNRGAEKIVQELSRMVGQSLQFVDLMENDVIPAHQTLPNNYTFKDLLKITSKKKQEKFYELTVRNEVTHHLYPIWSGSVILGCLIVDASRSVSRLGQMALEQGASVLALELVQKQNIIEFYYKNQREVFNSLIQTNDPAFLLQQANELGIDEKTDFAVVIFQYTNYTDSQLLEAYVHRLISKVRKKFASAIQMIFGYQNQVILLAALPTLTDISTFEHHLNDFLSETASAKKFTLSGAMGSVYNGIHLIKNSYQEAEIALSNPVSRKIKGRLVKYSDIGINRLFTHQNTDEIGKFLVDIFEPLKALDKQTYTLEKTLITYFEHNRSANDTANALHIHINTLYQRLKKIEDCLQLSFKKPEEVLQLQLACYLKESIGY